MKPILTGDLIVNKGFSESDTIATKIARFNYLKGLKSILGGAWTYDKLAKNASNKLGISYSDAYRMGVDELLKLA